MVSSIPLRSPWPITAVLFLLNCLSGWSERSQAAPDPCAIHSSERLDKASDLRVIRWITDPGTRRSWLMVQDRKRPTAPARLIAGSANLNNTGAVPEECAALKKTPLVHAGDSVIVEEHTGAVDARLEATALTGASAGDPLTIRLKIGGRILRARAVAPGRAVMPAGREVRP